ncbi:MAG: acyl-CoA dehydrogenase family protein, partial [Gammaproteobacteria bacterium]|nr:acyl-CoA dehydrogenase family protein [Gammaproteobacteria bacterium]
GFSAAQAISRWGNGAQQSRYLPPFCEAEPPKATLAIDEARVLFDPQRLNTRAHTSEKGFILSGEKHAVPLAGEADVYLVAAHLEGNGPRLFLVERGCEGLSWKPSPAMGLRAAGLGTLHLDKVKVPSEALLGNNEAFDYAECLAHGALMRCALAVGTAQAVLDYVIPYCNEREAFGEPISHRQSVAFMIANMAIEIDAMRLLVWRAASLCEQGLPFVRETRLAQLLCNEKSMEVGTNGVQLLGGHGFVKEHPVERWYRDLRATAIHTGGLHA